jgi:hypothetical protein
LTVVLRKQFVGVQHPKQAGIAAVTAACVQPQQWILVKTTQQGTPLILIMQPLNKVP